MTGWWTRTERDTHWADEEDSVVLAAPAGLVLDVEVHDRECVADGLLELCDGDGHVRHS